MTLVDTGPLVAAANSTDRRHADSVLALNHIRGPRLVPGPVIAETCHLLAREAGARVEAAFLRSFASRPSMWASAPGPKQIAKRGWTLLTVDVA